MKRRVVTILAMAFALGACKGPQEPSDYEIFQAREDVCFMVGYKDMIDFSQGNLQFSYNPMKNIYRAGISVVMMDESSGLEVEIGQQYFVLQLEAGNLEVGSAVKGKIQLCSDKLANGSRSYTLTDAKLIKADLSKLWIWDDNLRLGMIVPIG